MVSSPPLGPTSTAPHHFFVRAPSLGPPAQEGCGAVGATQRRTTKMLEQLPSKDWLRKLGLFNLGKGRLWEDLTAAFQYLKGAHEQEGN